MERINLSLLDRLIDNDPRTSIEAPLTHGQTVRIHKDAVRRDLEWLLNTRRNPDQLPESLRELNRSLYIYGLPDFTAYSMANPKDQKKLIAHLQTTIKLFEPRLGRPRLILVPQKEEKSRMLRFRIEAMLLMDPAPEQVSFDTILQLTSGEYEVKDAG